MVEVDVVSGQEEEDVVALEINGQDQPQTLYLMVEKGLGRERERELGSLVMLKLSVVEKRMFY